LRATGRRVELYRQDLALTDELTRLIDEITATVAPIDVLVNNAAVSHLERFNDVTVDRWRTLMAINLDAPFFLSQRVAEHMIACGIRGRIINLSSKNGLVAEAGLVPLQRFEGRDRADDADACHGIGRTRDHSQCSRARRDPN
jgi:NAD(P)-dependent dehydrogenase (short-subunit alcohol dehydrogenase family)